MATIVQHKETRRTYVLIGSGYGVWATAIPSAVFGSLNPNRETGTMKMLAVADASGVVEWFSSDDLVVVTIDGKTPHQLLESADGPYR